MSRKSTLLKTLVTGAAGCALAAGLAVGAAQAQVSDDAIKIGLLTDMTGTYSDLAGQGAIIAAQMAIDDMGGKIDGKPIVLLTADHQNKADIAANKAREWVDVEKVDVFAELVTTSVALAVNEIAKANNKISLVSGTASSRVTNQDCFASGFHWTYDTYAMAVGTGRAMVEEGGKSWYFLTADYAFGQNLQDDVAKIVKASGGEVMGAVKHPFPASDFSSFLLQAQASKAQVIGLANAGADTTNAIKAANEFGIVQGGQKLAGLLVFITDIHSLGLETAQGLNLTTGFYWDMDDQTRAWSKRFQEKAGKMPSMVQAGVYSSLMHYFKGVEATKTDSTDKVVEWMKGNKVEDFFSRNGRIREDGRMVHDMYLAQVKTPAESKAPWDYYKLVRTIPAEEAFAPLSESQCPLVKK